ncbi:hypothetical protein SK128_003104 [Halocaridina rubra]|uniref:Fibronectin type-III domain-containing protein n=1 Tax=Halocaridina rubra TaxID=373956 RepID=A0AAN8WYC0_HALRR
MHSQPSKTDLEENQREVCYHAFGYNATRICDTTAQTTFVITGLEPCVAYEIEVTSVAPSGSPSTETLKFLLNTDEILPGAPKNLQAFLTADTEVTLTWDEADHATCIAQYAVLYQEIETTGVLLFVSSGDQINVFSDHMVVIRPLEPCSNYNFKVAAVSKSDNLGPWAERQQATPEGDPGPVNIIDIATITTDSMLVTWDPPKKCVDHFYVCYYDEYEASEVCQNVSDTEVLLFDLKACTEYFVSVTVVTPSGIESNRTWKNAETLELAPGEPENLQIIDVTSSSIDVQYDPPQTNPQCAVRYDYEITDLEMGERSLESRLDNIFSDLKSCTNYEAKVRAVSGGGLTSAWVSEQTTTLEDMPSAPRNLQAPFVTNTDVDLLWYEPEINGRCAHSYNLTWNTGSTVIAPSPGENLNFQVETTVSSLSPCTSYNFAVTAISPNGISADSNASINITTTC